MALCSGKRADGAFCMNAVLMDGGRCRSCQERDALRRRAGEDLGVLEALCTRVSGDASGAALSREVREQLGSGAHVNTISGALGRLEDAGLVEPKAGSGLPRGPSTTRLWRPTALGWRAR